MKCEFCMDKVVFMGLLLSKYGIGPTEERVQRHTTQVIADAS